MKTITPLLLLIFSLFAVSCEDVVTIDTGTSEPRLVVDASILWYKGYTGESQVIKLSTSTSFYSTEIPMASGATVNVTNSNGKVFTFEEDQKYPGIYVCNRFIPELYGTYDLTIKYDGDTYTATEMMYPVPDLLYTTQENGGITPDATIVKAYFKDPAEEENFYMQRFIRPEKLSQSAVFDDEFVNGNETFTVRFFDELPHDEEINIQLMGISQKYYDYMSKIYITVSETNAGPFETPPADIRGNVINRSNPDKNAYGYFRLSEVSNIEHITD
jgi:hypothetical protein